MRFSSYQKSHAAIFDKMKTAGYFEIYSKYHYPKRLVSQAFLDGVISKYEAGLAPSRSPASHLSGKYSTIYTFLHKEKPHGASSMRFFMFLSFKLMRRSR